MYLINAQIEIDDVRRPEELDSVKNIELKVELLFALALHAHFGFVKIIQVEVLPPHAPADTDIPSLSEQP